MLDAVGRASPFTRGYLVEAHPVSLAKNVFHHRLRSGVRGSHRPGQQLQDPLPSCKPSSPNSGLPGHADQVHQGRAAGWAGPRRVRLLKQLRRLRLFEAEAVRMSSAPASTPGRPVAPNGTAAKKDKRDKPVPIARSTRKNSRTTRSSRRRWRFSKAASFEVRA